MASRHGTAGHIWSSSMRHAGKIANISILVASILCCGSDKPLAADAAAGRSKASMCAPCHGIDGIARTPDAPHIAGENQVYLVNQLKAFRSGERKHEIMSLIAKDLSDEDIANLAAWYSSIEISVKLPE